MIAVRPYGAGDAAAFLALMRACRRHYGCEPIPDADEREMLAELSAPHGMQADIAWDGAAAVGFACWQRVFPASASFAIYMKELFVTEAARGTGAGRALMAGLARRAMESGWDQVRWETKEPEAKRFYARLGARDDGKTHYTLAGEDLAELAGSRPA